MFVPLSHVAHVTLGYKSLQNDFFYLGQDTIDTYRIEPKYLRPILMLRDLDATAYLQAPTPSLWLFHCPDEERDLRGTGAHRYIQTMGDRAATQRKQTKKTGPPLTIRQALELQGGNLWYAPKALPHRRALWLRKAFDGVYAPFVFEKPALVDQRCNAVSALDKAHRSSLAAVITSTLFAYSLEINGSASMGAGALEAPTTRLRAYPVFDVRKLRALESKELERLARAVWENELPVDWTNAPKPGKHLRELDKWLLARAGSRIPLDTLYRDLSLVCGERILVARDKARATKKHRSESITGVAKGIAETVGRLLESRRFPEDFCHPRRGADGVQIHLARERLRKIEMHQFMHTADLTITGESPQPLFSEILELHVAEAIVRALLFGRGSFAVTDDPTVAEEGVTAFLKWFSGVGEKLADAVANSALGTGYERQLTAEVYRILGLHPAVGEKILPPSITFPQQANDAP